LAQSDRATKTFASGLTARLKTLLAIVGPGLIVVVGDNDAGAFGTYTQAGQNDQRSGRGVPVDGVCHR
jgi:hypothetical protein